MTQRAVPAAEGARRLPHGPRSQVLDHMFLDGLEDAYDKGRLMGMFAEDCADKFAFTREAQDAFAHDVAVARARAPTTTARSRGRSRRSPSRGRKGDVVIDHDEQPAKASAREDSRR